MNTTTFCSSSFFKVDVFPHIYWNIQSRFVIKTVSEILKNLLLLGFPLLILFIFFINLFPLFEEGWTLKKRRSQMPVRGEPPSVPECGGCFLSLEIIALDGYNHKNCGYAECVHICSFFGWKRGTPEQNSLNIYSGRRIWWNPYIWISNIRTQKGKLISVKKKENNGKVNKVDSFCLVFFFKF